MTNPKTSMESRFEKKFMADGELLVPGDGIDDAKDIKAFIKAELAKRDKKWRSKIEMIIGYIGNDKERKMARNRYEALKEKE